MSSIVHVFRVTLGEPGNEGERLIVANSAERALEVARCENLIPRRTITCLSNDGWARAERRRKTGKAEG
jgi:hypothetical protein